jgi:hypothetical protein
MAPPRDDDPGPSTLSFFSALTKNHKPGLTWSRELARGRLALMIASSLSCAPEANWTPTELQPERFQQGRSPSRATVVLLTGESLLVQKPVLSHDSLTWVWPYGSHRRSAIDSTERCVVPTSEIKAILVENEPPLGAGGVIFVLVWTAAGVMGVFLIRQGIP